MWRESRTIRLNRDRDSRPGKYEARVKWCSATSNAAALGYERTPHSQTWSKAVRRRLKRSH